MYVIFDTETTGLPKSRKATFADIESQPRIVQIAWLQLDKQFKPLSKGNFIIKPNGYEIPNEAIMIHGITNANANENGYEIEDVLNIFDSMISISDYIIGHNVEFDMNILMAEFLRLAKVNTPMFKQQVCTMKSAVDFCAIPNQRGDKFRYPKLHELYSKLFDSEMEGAHDAMKDVEACAKCFWKMHKDGLILNESQV